MSQLRGTDPSQRINLIASNHSREYVRMVEIRAGEDLVQETK